MFIAEFRNIFIAGTTGIGTTYQANACGMEACKQYYRTQYVRLPDLLLELECPRSETVYKKIMQKYSNPVILVIDEWLLLKPTPGEAKDISELLHKCRKRSSAIFGSQYPHEGWYEELDGDDSTPADAILDRIVHDSYKTASKALIQLGIIHERGYGLDKRLSK